VAFGLGFAFVLFVLAEAPLQAYLDPGNGSMLVQLLLGGAAGIGVILKLTWLRLRSGFKLKPSTAKKDRVPERDE
jgi:mannose/fructose/N-acetylgalactosamine-specific phosphotransferase system component IIC